MGLFRDCVDVIFRFVDMLIIVSVQLVIQGYLFSPCV